MLICPQYHHSDDFFIKSPDHCLNKQNNEQTNIDQREDNKYLAFNKHMHLYPTSYTLIIFSDRLSDRGKLFMKQFVPQLNVVSSVELMIHVTGYLES